MVWFNPTPTPIQQQPAAPRPEDRVLPVATVRDQPQQRSNQERNRRRRQLFDILMQEVEAIPELEPKAKERLRVNLRELAREQDRPTPARRPLPPAAPPVVAAPPAEEHHPEAPPAADPHADHVVAALVPVFDPSEPVEGEALPLDAEENARVAEQLRRCLSLHTERARKISSYIQALLALTEEVHTLQTEA